MPLLNGPVRNSVKHCSVLSDACTCADTVYAIHCLYAHCSLKWMSCNVAMQCLPPLNADTHGVLALLLINPGVLHAQLDTAESLVVHG